MKTPKEYVDSIKALKRDVYFMAEKVEDTTEDLYCKGSLNAVAMTYGLAKDEKYEDIMTATSHLSGKKINRFTHINQNADDMVKKVKMLRLMGQETATCFQRCAGMDAMNSVYGATYDIDKKHNTVYHHRFKKFIEMVQQEDLVVDAAMTDPKGDRSKSPSQQEDLDQYLRVVERREDGIVVYGAKQHQTGALNSHQILVMPTCAMKEEDKDFAVIFSVPADAKGLVYVVGRQPNDQRSYSEKSWGNIDNGNPSFAGQETLIVFDHVFVPNEQIYMCGEYDFAGLLVERFASYHRQSYGGCKVGVGDTLIGATALIAEYNGTEKASHIKDKLVEMTYLNEIMFAAAISAGVEGSTLPAGSFWVNPLLANTTKLTVTQNPYKIARIAQDIAGGILVTMQSAKEMDCPEIAKYVEKFCKAKEGFSTEDRMRVLRFIENLTIGRGAAGYLTESLHGAGSPQAQRVMISRYGNYEEKKKMSRKLAKIKKTS